MSLSRAISSFERKFKVLTAGFTEGQRLLAKKIINRGQYDYYRQLNSPLKPIFEGTPSYEDFYADQLSLIKELNDKDALAFGTVSDTGIANFLTPKGDFSYVGDIFLYRQATGIPDSSIPYFVKVVYVQFVS